MSLKNPVKKLDAEVARKIAAGEVIDRPNAIVRELMDNSIDSGAKTITVEISGGGIEKIRIVDDGCGMTKEDLQNCARPHATSKISSEIDLLNLTTLGFRGEALSSIAAVSRLSIISGGWKMRASITEDHILEPQANITGTIVQSEGLFENFPARRQFLKRPATEALMCKNTFIEKTLAHPEIAFRFIQDGEIKIDLPQNQSLKERFVMANGLLQYEDFFFEISKKSSYSSENCEWSFDVIIGEPAVSRPSKKDIEIFANGRKIQEYSLVQAVEYGCQGFFPNGTYPVAGVFVHVRPDLIDFNIHPAKKEARFYDISDLHHGLSSTIKDFFKKYTYANFSEDKSPDEIRSQDFFDIYSDNIENQTGTKNTYASIHYKTSETNNAQLSDFRSKYLGIKSQNSQNQSQNSYLSRTKLYDIAQQALDAQKPQSDELNQNLEKIYNQTVKKITEDYENLNINTAISQMMIFINAVYKENIYPKEYAEGFLKLLNPVAPFITEELWNKLGHNKTIAYEPWPTYDETKIVDTTIEIGVQVNGKLRASITIDDTDTEDTIKEKALKEENIKKYTDGKEIIKVIVVPKRIVSVVIK